MIGQRGYRRFLEVNKDSAVKLNEPAIVAAAQWNGLHGEPAPSGSESAGCTSPPPTDDIEPQGCPGSRSS